MGKILYSLRENPFSRGKEDKFIASMRTNEVLDKEDLIDAMLWKNTTLSRQDILAVMDLMRETVEEKIIEGHRVSTDFFKAGASIKGGFRTCTDRFDPKRHSIAVSLNASPQFCRDISLRAGVERINPLDRNPLIRDFYDYAGSRYGAVLSAGGLVALKGARLCSEKALTRVVLYRSETNRGLPPLRIHEIRKKKILLSLPAELDEGEYRIEVILDQAGGMPKRTASRIVKILSGNREGDTSDPPLHREESSR